MATGWQWDYVWENMTFQRLEIFTRTWKHSPPPHKSLGKISFMLQSFLGYKDAPGVAENASEARQLAAMPDIEE